MTTATDYTVSGMTCAHCVQSVTAELKEVDGVEAVDVDLGTGRVRVVSEIPLDTDAVRAAIDEAGYELVDSGGEQA
jgi:copper chaperone CopZ